MSCRVVLKTFEDRVMTLANTLEEQNGTIQTSAGYIVVIIVIIVVVTVSSSSSSSPSSHVIIA